MRLNPARGNMYNWITHTANPLAGACPHDCSYCYVDDLKKGLKVLMDKYSGPPRLNEKDMRIGHGSGKVIFVCNCVDLFADGTEEERVPDEAIAAILKHLNDYPDNTYILQTKNPERFLEWTDQLPPQVILATTIETNRTNHQANIHTNAPEPKSRAKSMEELRKLGFDTMINLEPIATFDVDQVMALLIMAEPKYISIGADSSVECHHCGRTFNWQLTQRNCPQCGGQHLVSANMINEPDPWKIEELLQRIAERTRSQLLLKKNLLRICWKSSVAKMIEEAA